MFARNMHLPSKLVLVVLLTSQSLISCVNSKNKDSGVSNLNVDNTDLTNIKLVEKSSIFIDSIFLAPKFIRLESGENCLIGKISKVFYEDDLIFIMDKVITHSVFVFDAKGRFLNKISRSKTTRNPYLQISDVVINVQKKRIELIDNFSKKVIYYSYSCKFLESNAMSFLYSGYAYVDSCNIAYYTGRLPNSEHKEVKNYMINVSSNLDSVKAVGRHLTTNQISGKMTWDTFLPPLWKYGDDVFFNPMFSDTIYKVTESSLKGVYAINMPGRILHQKYFKDMDDSEFSKIKSNYSFLNGNFIELKDYGYFAMQSDSGYTYAFYSKNKKRSISGSKIISKNPFFLFFTPPIGRIKENGIISVISASACLTTMKYIKSHSLPMSYKNNEMTVLEEVKEGDNPLLCVFNFKTF